MVSGIFLAAGRGRRFGGDKLLHPLSDGTPLGVAALRPLRAALTQVVAVVRDGNGPLAALLSREGARVVACPHADRGLGASLAWGVSHAGEPAGCVIALGDMPFVQTDTVRAVAGAVAAGADIAAPFFQGRRGHPVGFAALYRDQLRELDGDEGARFLLERDASRITRIAVNDPGVLRDVDVLRDLAG